MSRLDKPRVTVDLQDAMVRNGTIYKLNCSATGDPIPLYHWTKDGNDTIPNSALTNTSQLIINPMTFLSQGIYTFMVQNVEGRDTTSANITV